MLLPFLLQLGCQKEAVFSPDGTFIDQRDDHVYKWIKIGEQTWMAENLAYLPFVNSSLEGSNTSRHYYVYDYQGADESKAKSHGNYKLYGVLYNYAAAVKACPGGWHLPVYDEFSALFDFLIRNGYGFGGSGEKISKSLASTTYWMLSDTLGAIGNDPASNNRSGFTALPAGYRIRFGSFVNRGYDTHFWLESDGVLTLDRQRDYNIGFDYWWKQTNTRSEGYSVRYLKD